MHPISFITHSSPLATEKVNFFADYYSFVVNQMGKNSLFEIETLLSLTEKLIFQLELNNLENVMQYIHCHINNPIFSGNKYFEECSHFEKISTHLSELKRVHKLKKQEQMTFLTQNKTTLLVDFKKFRTYLKKNEFRRAVKEVVSYLKCVHELDFHKEEIKFQTRIIAATLFYTRNGKADISNVFSKIMSRSIHEFPFPPKLLEKHKSDSTKVREEFMANRTFDQQFGGIVNFKEKREKIKFFVFRIGNLNISDTLEINLNNVQFYSINHPRIIEIKEACTKRGTLVEFISPDFGLYAIVRQETIEETRPQTQAIKKLQGWLDEINLGLDAHAFVDRDSYLFTRDSLSFGGKLRYGDNTVFSPTVNENRLKEIMSIRTVDKLFPLRSKAKKQFLLHEPLYLEAKRTQDISRYWQYLENMLEMPLKGKLVKIASKRLMEIDQAYLEEYLERCFDRFQYSPERTGISVERALVIQNKLKSSKIDLNDIKKETSHPFINELIDMIQDKHRTNSENYILRILTEIQECRNFRVHAGLNNQSANLKLIATVGSIMIPFRNVLINSMRKNPKLNLNEIIELHNNEN